ncbi:hypothetical protein GGI12_000630 [Dipsacomyces acuminosporus]|nr:hypothetical protein GGI12_000630 [Dipsacomyces acuminosporus]
MSGSTVYGNRISLISKSGIRYTGTLNDVNEQEQTISLEQVRSMGTEGRKGNPLEEIPPSNDVYEYIQFRATDVISVQFENEAPPQPAPPQVPNDPAILDARAQPRSQAAPAPAPAAPAAASAPAPVQQQQQPPAQPQAPAPAPAQAPPQSYARTVAPAAEQSAPVQPATAAATTTTEEPAGASGQDQTADDQTTGHRRQGGYAPRGGYVQRGGRGGPAHRGGHRRGGYQGRGGYQPRQGGRRIEIPESDFDFESSNSKLNKDDLAKEFAKLSVEHSNSGGYRGSNPGSYVESSAKA